VGTLSPPFQAFHVYLIHLHRALCKDRNLRTAVIRAQRSIQ
jgi:hypothetical protein